MQKISFGVFWVGGCGLRSMHVVLCSKRVVLRSNRVVFRSKRVVLCSMQAVCRSKRVVFRSNRTPAAANSPACRQIQLYECLICYMISNKYVYSGVYIKEELT